ncbi:helix-turn-helix domain-containing protein [Carnobacterium gallinarum]
MLRKKQHEKLLLLKEVIKSNVLTTDLAKHLNLSTRVIKSNIQEINEEILSNFERHSFIVMDTNGLATLNTNYQKDGLVLLNKLKSLYLEASNEFKIITTVFSNPNISLNHLSNSLFISPSYIRRIIKKLNTHLNEFEFGLIEEKAHLNFQGNELAIRLFLYVVLFDSYQTSDYHFSIIDFDTSSKSNTEQSSVCPLFEILSKRKDSSSNLPIPSTQALSVLKLIQRNADVIPALSNYEQFDTDILKNPQEALYINFFIHIFSAHLIPENTKIKLGEIFMKDENKNEITKFSLELTKYIWSNFSLDYNKKQQTLVVFYFTLLNTYYDLLDESYPINVTSIFYQSKVKAVTKNNRRNQIERSFEKFIAERKKNHLPKKFSANESLKKHYCDLIYTITEFEFSTKINIHIRISKDFSAHAFIKNKLLKIYNSQTLVFTTDVSNCELIITDMLGTVNNHSQIFYFDKLQDKKQWSALLNTINTIVFSKLFNY